MTGLSILAFGRDRRWTAHLQRALGSLKDGGWVGVVSIEDLQAGAAQERGLWLLDGDDARVGRLPRPEQARALRIYCYRHPDVRSLRECVRLGGSGCLDKETPPQVLLRAVRSVECGLFAADAALLTRAMSGERRAPPPTDALPHLTERQREIVHWAALGLSNKQIGRRLGISPESVKSHLHQVFAREGVSGRVALLSLRGPPERTREKPLVE